MTRPAAGSSVAALRAAPGTAQLAPADYAPTPIWGYGAKVPGPEIRIPQGGELSRRLINELPQATTIHWHGIRIDNAMDGVPDMTQAAVLPGESFDYSFRVPDAGTYWYHPHNRTWEQLARGLYGALVVVEETPPDVDADLVLLIDDWRFAADATLHESFGSLRDWSHAGRIGNWVTVNGVGEYAQPVKAGARLRLRLVNVANARIFPLVLRGFEARVVALDGQPLDAPRVVERITLAPAQRADLIVDVTASEGETAHILEEDREGLLAVADFPVEGRSGRTPGAPLIALPPNPVPRLGDLDQAPRAVLRMEGGAMGRMSGAMMGGRMMAPRDLAGEGKVWAFNGMAELPESPLIAADLGQTVRIAMINDTAWPHAMHLHGHHFRVIGPEGKGPLRDTTLVNPDETVEIAFVADNPGDWLLHCHMVEHSAGGMMTWIRVGA
ncbi:multicopper oxidase family protein [Ovoidimarina sediminis]|uniref:multicopper oxidase family protein n=1 Tax=Ovoidimarina sediminis TaxID=3079856 RepID=UPI00290E86F3|nr:multicopper oxidase family protein [Rhodophyticola sp. MJ-SS7]MDU8944852.1 multicopper oxidase family protein [Rhodophyticola sp. MJ-SS7]